MEQLTFVPSLLWSGKLDVFGHQSLKDHVNADFDGVDNRSYPNVVSVALDAVKRITGQEEKEQQDLFFGNQGFPIRGPRTF